MLTSFARGRTFIPDGAMYPVWLSPEGTDTIPDADESVFLKLDIPEGFYILANNEVWDYMINHLYYPESRFVFTHFFSVLIGRRQCRKLLPSSQKEGH